MSRPGAEGASHELEAGLNDVELRLAALAEAAQRHDSAAIEIEAAALHTCLSTTVRQFARVAHSEVVPAPLRRRLAAVAAQVAAQREVMARATASLDRAIDVLMPGSTARRNPLYNAAGIAERSATGGSVQA